MTNTHNILRIMTFLSPTFPIGGFAYSHGLETAFSKEIIKNRDDLRHWIHTLIIQGSGWCDALFCAESWRHAQREETVTQLATHCAAFASSQERYLETIAQGEAFLKAAQNWPNAVPEYLENEVSLPWPLPVAVGAVCRTLDISLETSVTAYLQSFSTNLIQVALRLGKIGQNDGVALQSNLEAVILQTAETAVLATLEDLGSATVFSDIMSMNHETLNTRIFRS